MSTAFVCAYQVKFENVLSIIEHSSEASVCFHHHEQLEKTSVLLIPSVSAKL